MPTSNSKLHARVKKKCDRERSSRVRLGILMDFRFEYRAQVHLFGAVRICSLRVCSYIKCICVFESEGEGGICDDAPLTMFSWGAVVVAAAAAVPVHGVGPME